MAAVETVIQSWLRRTTDECASGIKASCSKPSVKIESTMTGMYSSRISITDPNPSGPFTIAEWAFDTVVQVPPEGYKPESGKKAVMIVKPWGEVRYRSVNYKKLRASLIKRQGFAEKETTKIYDPTNIDIFAEALSEALSALIVAQTAATVTI